MKAAAPSPTIALFSGSSARRTTASLSTPPSIVVLKQTALQSADPIVHELLRRDNSILLSAGDNRRSTSVAYATVELDDEYQPSQSSPPTSRSSWSRLLSAIEAQPKNEAVTVVINTLDSVLDHYAFGSADAVKSVYKYLRKVVSALNGISRLVLVSNVPSASLQPRMEAELLSMVTSPHFGQSDVGSSASAGPSASLQILELHPPALWRHLFKQYGTGLRPASTPSHHAVQLQEEASQSASKGQQMRTSLQQQRRGVGSDAMPASKHSLALATLDNGSDVAQRPLTDPRLWPILAQLSAQCGFLGAGCWFFEHESELVGEEVEAVRCADQRSDSAWDSSAAKVTLADLLGPSDVGPHSSSRSSREPARATERSRIGSQRSRHGWGVIVSKHRLPGGKYGEEAFGCVCRLEGEGSDANGSERDGGCANGASRPRKSQRLRLVPLDMTDRRPVSAKTAPPGQKGDGHADLVSSLPFSLSLTEDQKARRDRVGLPFAPTDRIYEGMAADSEPPRLREEDEEDEEEQGRLRRGTTGQSTIYFEPEDVDEEDDEDPDDF